MHIAIDAHLAIKEIDGIARYLNGLLKELPKIDSSILYTILCLPQNKTSLPVEIFSYQNVKCRQVNLNGPTPKQHLITPWLLREIKADLYHHPQYDLPLGVKIPSVVTIHDLKYIIHPEYFQERNRIKSWYIKKSLQRSVRVAKKIIAVSQHTLEDLKKYFSFDSNKETVIHHGINPVELKINEKNGRNAIEKDYILFVGTRRPHKNIEGLIRALAILRNHYNIELDLIVAGKAYSDYRNPERVTHEHRLDENVHFMDFVSDEELPQLYRSAKVSVLPSFYEGFGLPLLESMAYSTPVIGSNLSSIPKVVGDAGLLVDPHSPDDIAAKIYKLLSDKQLYKKLSKAGMSRYKQFSWHRVAEATLDVYIKALESSSINGII